MSKAKRRSAPDHFQEWTFQTPDSDCQARARDIMGENFFGLQDLRRTFAFLRFPIRISAYAEIPFSEKTLRRFKDTHALFPILHACVGGLAHWFPNVITVQPERDEPFRLRRPDRMWYLLRKEAVPKSCGKSYEKQIALLSKAEEVPFACEVVIMVFFHRFMRHQYLFPSGHVRCNDESSHISDTIVVGDYNGGHFADPDKEKRRAKYFYCGPLCYAARHWEVKPTYDALIASPIGLASSVRPDKS